MVEEKAPNDSMEGMEMATDKSEESNSIGSAKGESLEVGKYKKRLLAYSQ
ncbi:hypothetical protein [Salimicrobium humidisoli]|nr:hypothetical protein [Salimicrobium humidisoli]